MMVPSAGLNPSRCCGPRFRFSGFPSPGRGRFSRRFTQRNGQGKRSLRLARRLTPNGLEQCGLLAPVEHPENVPDVFNEEAVRRRAELGKKEQLLLNFGSEIGEQQNLRQTTPAEASQRRELFVARDGSFFHQLLTGNRQRQHSTQGGNTL